VSGSGLVSLAGCSPSTVRRVRVTSKHDACMCGVTSMIFVAFQVAPVCSCASVRLSDVDGECWRAAVDVGTPERDMVG